MKSSLAYGPAEPEGFARLRAAYWDHHAWLAHLEDRIQMTDAGLAWLMRVKTIGH